MLSHNTAYNMTGKWDLDAPLESFFLVLSSSAADDGKKHVDLYSHKGLMKRLEGVSALADWMGLPKKTVISTLKQYQNDAAVGLISSERRLSGASHRMTLNPRSFTQEWLHPYFIIAWVASQSILEEMC